MAVPVIPTESNSKIPYAYRRDLSWALDLDDNGDLKMIEDVDAVNQSLYALMTSNFGDKPLEEFFGSDIATLLFEPTSPPQFMQYEINQRLADAVRRHEPSITILSTNIDNSDISRNIIHVTITYLLSDGITTGIFDENMAIVKSKP